MGKKSDKKADSKKSDKKLDKKAEKKSGSKTESKSSEAKSAEESGRSVPTPAEVARKARARARTRLAGVSPDYLGIGPEDKNECRDAIDAMVDEAAELHQRLWSGAKGENPKSLLICLQGMDTSGKGGATKAIDTLLDPLGFSVVGFGPPSAIEREHHYLWRHDNALPEPGRIRVWDRSHYETVLIERVRNLVPEETWRPRYEEINAWEADLATKGVKVIKCMLHISKEEQKSRLLARLDDPSKHWKFNPGDVDERAFWDNYQAAYQDALNKCSTDSSPWYIVPANNKRHRDFVLASLVLYTLRSMKLTFPKADFDVDEQRARVEAS